MAENKRAAGVIFCEPGGKTLLCERSDGQGWAFPAGGIEDGETPEQAARREAHEETGWANADVPLEPWSRRIKDGVDFFAYMATVPELFTPTLNDEHKGHTWVRPDDALAYGNLHPGAAAALKLFGANELDVARMIRDGELTSPQRYGNFMLVALRITGTGASYRPALDEYVWREPSVYLNDDFLERCQGLPVLERHPSEKLLDSDGYKKHSVGTVMLPYIKDDEVWCVARVYDAKTIEKIETNQLSTSPGVNTGGKKIKLEGGKHILVEDDPQLVDHVAICADGVWDKGDGPTGIDMSGADTEILETTPIGDNAMPDPVKPESGEEMTDSKRLDAILTHVKSLHTRHDSIEERIAKLEGRAEGEGGGGEKPPEGEEKKEPSAEGEAEGEHKKVEGEGEPAPLAADASRKDGSGGPEGGEPAGDKSGLPEERRENNLTETDGSGCGGGAMPRPDARVDELTKQLSSLQAELATVRASIPKELPAEELSRFVGAQAKAERVAQAYGDAAPRWLQGEPLGQYRRRLARPFQRYSKPWKDIDLATLPDTALEVAETQIYADAWGEATRPTPASAGTGLRKVTEVDPETGHRKTTFYGDPHVWLDAFSNPTRVLSKINLGRRDS